MGRERDDAALFRATRAGDAEAFAELYRRHRGPVLAVLLRRGATPEVAADLMAETFAAALTAVHAKREPSGSDALPWLLTVARNKLVDSARRAVVEQVSRQRLGMQPLILDDPGLARVEELGSSPEALAALARVPDHQRDAVRARVIDERGYADIARQLGCSEMVVRQRVSRGLRALRTTLEADA